METLSPRQLRQALKDRFMADLRFGVTALPVPPALLRQAATGTHGPAQTIRHPQGEVLPGAAERLGGSPALPARPPISAEESEQRRVQLEVIDRIEVRGCVKCGLHATRTKTVFGVGSPTARIMFVGEAPGHDEDIQGEPFVGRAGQLLNDMIVKGLGLRREDVYICNVLKCRPPNNRDPAMDEVIACKGYLFRQIQIVNPEVIIALGSPAAKTLLATTESIGRLRSRFHEFYPSGSALIGEAIPIMPTYHPAYLLRSPHEKPKAWADLKIVMQRLGIPLPRRG